jgi:hypothetical protein
VGGGDSCPPAAGGGEGGAFSSPFRFSTALTSSVPRRSRHLISPLIRPFLLDCAGLCSAPLRSLLVACQRHTAGGELLEVNQCIPDCDPGEVARGECDKYKMMTCAVPGQTSCEDLGKVTCPDQLCANSLVDCSFAYVGCWEDRPNDLRDLELPITDQMYLSLAGQWSNSNWGSVMMNEPSLQLCAALCDGYQYMGLQWTAECFCGNEYGSHGPATNCGQGRATSCADGQETCGFANGVFDLGPTCAQATCPTLSEPIGGVDSRFIRDTSGGDPTASAQLCCGLSAGETCSSDGDCASSSCVGTVCTWAAPECAQSCAQPTTCTEFHAMVQGGPVSDSCICLGSPFVCSVDGGDSACQAVLTNTGQCSSSIGCGPDPAAQFTTPPGEPGCAFASCRDEQEGRWLNELFVELCDPCSTVECPGSMRCDATFGAGMCVPSGRQVDAWKLPQK